MKKALSIMLSVLIAVLAIVPVLSGVDFGFIEAGAATSQASDAYATVFTASDFQDSRTGNDVEENFSAMIKNAIGNGTDTPDAFILGGDYESSYADKHSTPDAYERVEGIITDALPYYNTHNIVNIQGNHDVNDPTVIEQTGLYEFEHFLVYVINNSDYPAGTGGSSAKAKTEATTLKLVETFDKLLAEGETRPIFIATHIPLHHNSRNPNGANKDESGNVLSYGYNETLYSKVLFDAINAYGTVFDIVFLFGHNHSGNYDDYIGGAVNYIGKGDTIRIPDSSVTPSETSYTEETLNFTYMNYGFVGYSNNDNDATLTMGAFEICPDRIEVTRYSSEGVYRTHEITRNNNMSEPSVQVAGYPGATLGSATGALATASGFTDPVYTWTSSNNNIAKISASGRVAQIAYNQAGTATVTVTVAEKNDSSKTASDSYEVTVVNVTNATTTSIRLATQDISNKTLEYYNTNFGKVVSLVGCYEGLSANATATWSSSNSSVAEVDQYGNVTFKGTGSANITYTVTDTTNGYTGTASVRFIISTEPKAEYIYEEVENTSFAAGKSYVIATTRDNAYIYDGTLGDNGQGATLAGDSWTLNGTAGSRTVEISGDEYVWNTVETGTDGVYYLQNASTGQYLTSSVKSGETNRGEFGLSSTVPSISDGGWRIDSTGNLWNGTYYWYVRSSGIVNLLNSQKTNYVVLFERKTLPATVDIEFSGKSASGTTEVIYNAVNGTTIPLYGRYTNIEEIASETWTSSNTSVATIDNNGVVTFKGVQGETTITYKVKDAISGQEYSASFTIDAKIGEESDRIFRYTNKIEEGKNYIIVNNKNVGDARIFSGYKVTYEKLLADRAEVTLTADEEFQVAFPNSVEYNVWVPEKTDDGYFYLKNETDGEYLYAYTDGSSDSYGSLSGETYTSSSTATNPEQFKWTYSGGRLYNQSSYDNETTGESSSVTYIRARSADFVGLATQAQAEAYFYEEVMPDPNGIITLRYNVVGTKLEKTEICPGQSETLVPKAENFPDNEKVDFTWSSDNDDVATIDPTTGVITYTGKAGVVNVTLTSKSQAYDADGLKPEDTTTVKIFVNGGTEETEQADPNFYLTTEFKVGNKYIISNSNTAGDTAAHVMSNEYYSADTILKAVAATIESSDKGIYIANPGSDVLVLEAVDSGVEGYVKLKASNGKYLVNAYKDSDGNKLDTRLVVLADEGVHLDSQYLFKAVDNTLINGEDAGLNYSASSSGGTNRWSVSSTKGAIYIYESTAKAATDVVENAYYQTTTLVPGKKYVLHATYSDGTNVALSNENKNANHVRLLCEEIGAPQTDGNGQYVVTTDAALVWECVESGVDGYVYLKNTETGDYLFASRSTAESNYNKNGVIASPSDHLEASTLEYVEETILLSYDSEYGMIQSKQIVERANASNYGIGGLAKSGSGNYYYMNQLTQKSSSSRSFITLYAEPDAPEGGDGEVVEPTVQIRKVDYFGSVDITEQIEYRYGVQNGDTEQLYRYVEGITDGYTYTWESSNTSIASVDATTGLITYTGTEGYVTFTLTVTGPTRASATEVAKTTFSISNDESALSGSDYPEYPDQGSVSVDKYASNVAGGTNFQNSGVTEIELSVTGIPVVNPVDVVVVLDHSESMNASNKLLNSIEDTRNFALQLFNANEKNRIAIVTFDQFRYNYNNIESTTIGNSDSGKEDGIVTGDGSLENAFVTADEMDELVASLEDMESNNVSGTNYDSGLNYAYRILQTAKNDPDANEKQIVVFMSDGAATKFNGMNINSEHSDELNDAWLLGDETNPALAPYLADTTTYPAAANFNPNGDNWYAAAIKTAEGEEVEGLPNTFFYESIDKGLGAKIFTIGYGVQGGSTEETVLSTIASSPANYYSATGNLQDAYDRILEQIDNAATNAVVTDKMGAQYDVQFATSYKMGGTTITLNPVPKFEIGSWTVDSMGNRLEYTVLETITFETNENGYLTAASSSILGDGVYDVNNSMIVGQYVTYDLLNETFTWNIGDITRNEVTLKYYACLEGAAEGEREAGVFDTNEYAQLTYENFKGNACQRAFPVPTLGWKQAAVSYEFYLVNDAGQPVNLSGVVVPFSERVIIGTEQTKGILLNSSLELTSYNLIASDVLPQGYELYNSNASYLISVSSVDGNSSAVIDDTTLTTYFRDGSYAVNVNGTVPNVTDYVNTAVSFAVKSTGGVIPDSVVIDYGLPVRIGVRNNDYEYMGGKLNAIGTALADGVVLNTQGYASSQLADGVASGLALDYGTAYIDGDTIVYTPTSTAMDREETFYYEYIGTDGKYYYTTVTVIPAANIYYEESFMTFVDGDGYEWQNAGTAITGRFQAEDKPGTFSFSDYDANNAYGKDSAYDDSYTYSLGNAMYASVDESSYNKEPTATFTFCGTGFDLFSVTNNDTGAVLVTIYKAGTDTIYKNYLVSTYYGYTVDNEGALLPDSESTNGMYQVPVISARELGYGTYDVVIKPIYSRAFDPNFVEGGDKSANAYGIYVDSVRIFNPAGAGEDVNSDVVADAYFDDGEFAPMYMEVRDTILSADEYYNEVIENLQLGYTGSLFIDGNTGNGIDEAGIATYKEQGPNNELYLGKNQAIAFNVSAKDAYTLSSLQLGMKVVSGAETAEVIVMNTNERNPNVINVSGAHEQFYKLNSALIWNQNQITENDTYETVYPVVIINTSDSVVSLTSLKWAHTTDPEVSNEALSISVDYSTGEMASYAVRKVVNLKAAEDENYDDVSIEWSDKTLEEGKEGTLTVTTPADVVMVTIDGIEITDCTIDENGNKLWTYTFVVKQSGETNFEILFFDRSGMVDELVKTETVVIEKAPVTDDNPTTDDEPTIDDEPTGDEPNVDNSESILDIIFNFIKKILDFFGGIF